MAGTPQEGRAGRWLPYALAAAARRGRLVPALLEDYRSAVGTDRYRGGLTVAGSAARRGVPAGTAKSDHRLALRLLGRRDAGK